MKKKKILIIDDYKPLLDEVAFFLSIEGFQTISANDGSEGIQMAVIHRPDLIICDIAMPKVNGYKVFETLEKIRETASIPFIFLTAKTQPEDFNIGLQLGVDDYIAKPVELDVLLTRINKRLIKYEKLKNINQSKFEILLNNPLIGTFIFIENRVVMINEKFEEITSYSKKELNMHDNLSKLILSDKEIIISKLKACLKNIHEKVQIKISFINKSKRAVFIELFAKYIEIDSKNALIGSIIEINQTKNTGVNIITEKPAEEFHKIIDYLISQGKDNIVSEILNVKELFSFEIESNIQKFKQKYNLTNRENEVLILIMKGLTNTEIAEKLFISIRTVDSHRANLLFKTNTKNTASLVAFAFKNQLV